MRAILEIIVAAACCSRGKGKDPR